MAILSSSPAGGAGTAMTPRLPSLPTLGQFLAAAKAQGCEVRSYRGRTIVENPKVGIPVPLPPIQENEQLTQFMTEYLSRILQVDGFDLNIATLVNREWKPGPGEEN